MMSSFLKFSMHSQVLDSLTIVLPYFVLASLQGSAVVLQPPSLLSLSFTSYVFAIANHDLEV